MLTRGKKGRTRVVATSLFAACGGGERGGSEDPSRSGKGRPPLATPLIPDLATALISIQGHLLLLFFPHPPARKEEGERGHPAPRKGAAAPLTPACGEQAKDRARAQRSASAPRLPPTLGTDARLLRAPMTPACGEHAKMPEI
jgi:hypothetical protein